MNTASLAERLSLIIVADPDATDRSLLEVVPAVLEAGVPAIQLRAKRLTARETVEIGRVLRESTRRAGALFFVNDRVDVALVVEADGAHVGDDDLPLAAARRIVPTGFLLGRSVDTPQEARTATEAGADYLGVGPVYATTSKTGLGPPIGPDGVREVVAATSMPVVGIGGIQSGNTAAVTAAGAAGVAVISAVLAAPDAAAAAREILRQVRLGRG